MARKTRRQLADNERATKPELGSISDLGDGRYKLRVYAGTDSAGKERVRSKTVRRDTIEGAYWELEQFVELVMSQTVDPTSFAAVVLEFLDSKKAAGRAPTTLYGYRQNAVKHIIPALGAKRPDAITERDLDLFFKGLSEGTLATTKTPLAPSTLRNVKAVVKGSLDLAKRWKLVQYNTAQGAPMPKERKKDLNPPDAPLISTVLDALKPDPERKYKGDAAFSLFIRMAAHCGARRGEIAALRWSDFDDLDGDSPIVTVQHSVYDILDDEVGICGSKIGFKDTKTSNVKRLALGPKVAALLIEHRDLQREQAAKAGVKLVKNPFVFAGEIDGSIPWRPHRTTKRWERLRKKLKLPPETKMMDLRHSMATRMLGEGDDIRTVSGRLGHANPATTLRYYAAFMPEKDRAAALRMDDDF